MLPRLWVQKNLVRVPLGPPHNASMKKDKALREAIAIAKASRPAAPGEFVPFVGTIPNDPRFRALVDWANTLAKADRIVHASAEAKTTQATAVAILRAGKIARGEIVKCLPDRRREPLSRPDASGAARMSNTATGRSEKKK